MECSSRLCHVYGSPGQSHVCDPCYGVLQRKLLKLPSSLWWLILSFMTLKDIWLALTLCRTTLRRGIPLPYRWINSWSTVFGCPATFVNEGAYGKVYQTTLLERNNMPVALKVISKSHLYSLKHYRALLREIEVQKRLRHPMAIQLLEVFHDDRFVFLVMELAKGGDAFEWVVKQRAIPETLIMSFGRDLLQFSDDLFFKYNVVHRDLKLENILLMQPSAPGRTLVFKACDFGLARFVQSLGVETFDDPLVNEIVMSGGLETFATPCGTLGYTAPELLSAKDNRPQKLGLTTESIHRLDIYSIGVILHIMLTGAEPFPVTGGLKEHLRKASAGIRVTDKLYEHLSSEAIAMLQLLCGPPFTRPTAKQALALPFFAVVRAPGPASSISEEADSQLTSSPSSLPVSPPPPGSSFHQNAKRLARVKEVVFRFHPGDGLVALQQSKCRRTWSSVDAVIATSAQITKSLSNTGPLPPMRSLHTLAAPPSKKHHRLDPLSKEHGIARAEGALPSLEVGRS